MIRRLVKMLALLMVVIVLAVPVGALSIGDETLSGILKGLPVIGDYTDDIIGTKQDIKATLGEYADDTIYGFKSLYLDVLGFSAPWKTPKVVIDLPPLPRTADQSAPAAPPPAPPPETAEAAAGAMPATGSVPAEGQGMSPSAPSPPPEMAPSTEPKAAPPAPPPKPPPALKAEAKPAEKAAPVPRTAKPPEAKTAKPPEAKAAKLPAARKSPPEKDTTAEQDHKRGLLYYKGIGVTKDFRKAAQWFRSAAIKGHAGAQYNLGIMSYLGQGTEQDYAIAAKWFERAGQQDHAPAQYNLGFLYYEGKGVDKDNLQAFMWIDRSANLGDEKAIRARDTLQKALPKEIFKQ